MIKDFSQVMSERTDKQLVDIVTTKRDEYQPEALLAAEKEISLRKINVDTFYNVEEIAAFREAAQLQKEEIPFEWYHKLLTVLLPAAIIFIVTFLFRYLGGSVLLRALGFPIIALIHYGIYRRLKDNGYLKMAKDFLKWVTYTLFIYMALLLVGGLCIYFIFM